MVNEQGVCPICGSESLTYESIRSNNTGVFYPWICDECGSIGEESYTLSFESHHKIIIPKNPKVGDFVTVDRNLIFSGRVIEIEDDTAIVYVDNHTGCRIDSFKLKDLSIVIDDGSKSEQNK